MKRSLREKNLSILQYSSASSAAQGVVGRSKRKRDPSLPKDVIHTILLSLPAKVLHDQMRLACKEWYSIISDRDFVRTHLEMSPTTSSIVVQIGTELFVAPFVEKTCSVESSLTETRILLPGRILVEDLVRWSASCIDLALASCGHFKVVHVPHGFIFGEEPSRILIHTAGVDNLWREIDLESIPLDNKTGTVFLCSTISVSGFIYCLSDSHPFGFALDVNTEKMYTFSVPDKFSSVPERFSSVPENFSRSGKLESSFLISLETGLGFVGYTHNEYLWEIYELTDVKSDEWTKVADINFHFLRRELERIFQDIPGGQIQFFLREMETSGVVL